MVVLNFHKPTLVIDTSRNDFSYNRRIENEYNQILESISDNVDGMLSIFDQGNEIEVIQQLGDYANDLFDWALQFVSGLSYNLDNDDIRQWKMHSDRMSKHMRRTLITAPVKPLMDQWINENVGLIQSMPLNAAKKVQKLVLENLKTGQYRSSGLVEQIMKIGHVSRNRAKTIARTEVSKMSSGLTKARSEYAQIGYYIWKTSKDLRVRSSHSIMNNVLIDWNQPPSPEALKGIKSHGNYHAGCTFNCRCFPRPLLRISDITWPAKIYLDGRIQRINQRDFMNISNGKVPMAA